jgi:catechol-2,3-dioxygenase
MSAEVEQECKRVLLRLRESGMPVNGHVIRWTLRAVFTEKCPSLLDNLRLSQQWISYWARSKMSWRWRRRTTAASKLPLDWEQLGVEMAKRVGYRMGMNNVSKHTPSLLERA